MPPKRTRAAAAAAVTATKSSTVPAAFAGKKLKIFLSSSSSSSSSNQSLGASLEKVSPKKGRATRGKKASNIQEEEDDELELSDEEELDLESSPVKAVKAQLPRKESAGKIQLKLSLSKSPEPSSSASYEDEEIDLEEEEEDYGEESDEMENEVDVDEEADYLGEPEEVLPQKMTKRQKAMLEYNNSAYDVVNVGAPASAKEKEEITEEEALKRAEKTRRRQAQRDLKMEESKQATINRLLQKHGARSKKMKASQQVNKTDGNSQETESVSTLTAPALAVTSFIDAPIPEKGLRYQSSAKGNLLIITDTDAFEQVFVRPSKMPADNSSIHCAASGCKGLKKYTEPQTSRPVCSLECYRRIISS